MESNPTRFPTSLRSAAIPLTKFQVRQGLERRLRRNFAFEEQDDWVFWDPRHGKFATYANRVFALGEAAIDEAATYSFDCALNVFDNPISWLLAKRDGIVVLDWRLAFDRLREVPRIALVESLLPLYRRHMQPARVPELFIISGKRRAA